MMTYLLKGWHIRNEHFSLKNIKDKYVQCACKLLQRFNCPMLCLKSPESLAANHWGRAYLRFAIQQSTFLNQGFLTNPPLMIWWSWLPFLQEYIIWNLTEWNMLALQSRWSCLLRDQVSSLELGLASLSPFHRDQDPLCHYDLYLKKKSNHSIGKFNI